jgi:hypothetical protein
MSTRIFLKRKKANTYFEAKKNYYWENSIKQRYYSAKAYQDLLGDWVVAVCWGKKNTKLGRFKSVFCETEEKSLCFLNKIDRIRMYHGYMKIIC